MRGASFLVAVIFAAEIGDLRRFDTPRQLMAFLGLVPGERSTGDSVRRKGLTLAGNRRARRALIEAAWTYRYPARVSETLSPARGIAEGGARHRPEGAGSTVRPLPPAQRGRQEAAGGRGCDRARDGRIPLGHRPRDRTRVEAVFLSLLHKAGGGATVGNSRR
jgi:transposase